MDLNEIRKLVRLMEKAELTEVEIDDSKEGLRVHLKRGDGGGSMPPVVQYLGDGGGGQLSAPAPAPAARPAADAAAGGAPEHPPGTEAFLSPMVGTFYRSPTPDSDPFVSPGARFDEETVLCIVEAMKVMNEIKAERKGEVVEVLVENGEPIEFGQPLFLIKQA